MQQTRVKMLWFRPRDTSEYLEKTRIEYERLLDSGWVVVHRYATSDAVVIELHLVERGR